MCGIINQIFIDNWEKFCKINKGKIRTNINREVNIKFDELKNKLEIENFTGTTKIAIQQDFYASIYLSNMVELARQESDEIIIENNKEKDLKHEYKTNLNMLVGSLKDKFILMLLEKST